MEVAEHIANSSSAEFFLIITNEGRIIEFSAIAENYFSLMKLKEPVINLVAKEEKFKAESLFNSQEEFEDHRIKEDSSSGNTPSNT